MKPPDIPKDFCVVPTAEVEEGTLWVCADATNRRDSIEASCASCGSKVFHRPYAPEKTRKVCIACALTLMEEAEAAGSPFTPAVTTETAAELEAQKKGN